MSDKDMMQKVLDNTEEIKRNTAKLKEENQNLKQNEKEREEAFAFIRVRWWDSERGFHRKAYTYDCADRDFSVFLYRKPLHLHAEAERNRPFAATAA